MNQTDSFQDCYDFDVYIAVLNNVLKIIKLKLSLVFNPSQ